MKVSSYDSYSEEYSKAKKKYKYQTEGDEEEEEDEDMLREGQEEIDLNLFRNQLFQNQHGLHTNEEGYDDEEGNQSQTYQQEESEGVLDYLHDRQNTEMNRDDQYNLEEYDENGNYTGEDEKQMYDDYDYLQQKLENNLNEVEIDLDSFKDSKESNFKKDEILLQNGNVKQPHTSNANQQQINLMKGNNQVDIYSQNERALIEEHLLTQESQSQFVMKANCQFCDWKIRRIRFLRENLHIRYFEAFNFYFAKPINEILANYALPHVIALKDFSYYYDENEYLKRYYRVDEVPPRLAVLTNFFTNSYKQTRPNLIVTNQHKVLQKRNFKQARLFMRQVAKNVNNGVGYNANNNLYNKDDSSESEGYSSDKNNDSNQGRNNSQGNKKKTNLPSKVLNSHLSQTIPLSQNPSNQSGEHSTSQDAHEYDNYRNFILQMSFETSTHDIYYPSFSESRKDLTERGSSQQIKSEGSIKKQYFSPAATSGSGVHRHENSNKNKEQSSNNKADQLDNFKVDSKGIASYLKNMDFQNQENNHLANIYEENQLDPRLLELIIGGEQMSKQPNKLDYLKKQSNNIDNINQIIEQMQMQQQMNYLYLLDLENHQGNNNIEGGAAQHQNYNGESQTIYDPSKRVSTLISQSNSTQMSHFNTFNANNYIVGTSSFSKQQQSQQNILSLPPQSQLQQTSMQKQINYKLFDKKNLAELHLGSEMVRNMTSLNTEGRSSEPSIQPVFRDGFNFTQPTYSNEFQRNSHSQLPLQIQDLHHTQAFPNQNQQNLAYSQEDFNKSDLQSAKQSDSKKIPSSTQKSIQQVQQYILSQIKKQHDVMSMGRNLQATLSTQNSQHPFYTSLSPEQKDKKDTGSSLQKKSKTSKGGSQPKEFNDGKSKQINQHYSGQSTTNSNRKLLNERNFTEINLGSVFERLKLSNRLASLENKKNLINESNNLENFIQKVANNSLSRNNSTKKSKGKQSGGNTARPNQVIVSNDISPIGYTPRNFAKKNSNQKIDPSTSLKYLHTEQSPDQNRKLSHLTNNVGFNQIGDKKNSLSHNQLNSNSSMKKLTNTSKIKEQVSIDNVVISGRVSVSPTQHPYNKNQSQLSVPKSTNTIMHQMTTTLDHSSPGNNSVVNSLFKDSVNVKSSNNSNTNKRISSISNLRSKIISAGEQKSSLNSPSRICTDRESINPRLKQNKSPSLNTNGGVSKISQKKTSYKRGSNSKIHSPNSQSYQRHNPNSVLQNNYYQRGEDFGGISQINPNSSLNIQGNSTNINNWNGVNQLQQQNTQQSDNSSSNLQIQLLQQLQHNVLAGTQTTNNNSTSHLPIHHGSISQLQQIPQQSINGISQISNQQGISLANQKGTNKTISQRVLTHALTNTINKFYKNIIKNMETEGQKDLQSSSHINQKQGNGTPFSSQNAHTKNLSPSQNQMIHHHQTLSPQQQQQQLLQHQLQQQQQQQQLQQYQQQQPIESDLSPRITPSSIQNYQKQNVKKSTNTIQTRQQGRVKGGQSEEIAQKLIKSLCKQRVKQKDSIGSSNQMSLNLDILNSARNSSTVKGQEYRVSSQNGNYGAYGSGVNQAQNQSKQKQLLMRQKEGNYAQNNIGMTSLNGLISNQSINSSVNNINPQIISTAYVTNNTNNINTNTNQQSNYNSNLKAPIQKSITPSGYSSKNNINNNLNVLPSTTQNSVLNQQQGNTNFLMNGIANSQLNQMASNCLQPQQLQASYQGNGCSDNGQIAHHQRIESVKKVSSPRQSQPLIKPPQVTSSMENNSQVLTQKQPEYRAVRTEAALLTDESQSLMVSSFKNILNQNHGGPNNMNMHSSLNNQQQQLMNSQEMQINSAITNNHSSPAQGLQNKNSQSLNQLTKNQVGNALSPGRGLESKTKPAPKKQENNPQGSNQQQQFQLLTSIAQQKKAQEEFQLGNGFYTQRNTGKTRKKSNETGNNQKYIQSSRGSYQGHYADLSAWKHASLSNQQNGTSTALQSQGQQQYLMNIANNSREKSQSQQYQTMLNTSPIRQTQQSQQQNIQQYYQMNTNNSNNQNISSGNSQPSSLTQQQTACLLNQKIKQLSQKYQMQ